MLTDVLDTVPRAVPLSDRSGALLLLADGATRRARRSRALPVKAWTPTGWQRQGTQLSGGGRAGRGRTDGVRHGRRTNEAGQGCWVLPDRFIVLVEFCSGW